MKKWKKIAGIILLVVVAAGGYGLYLYNKKPPDTRKMPAAATLTAEGLVNEFKKDEAAASAKYIDKVIVVSGTVLSVEKNKQDQATLTLDSGDPMTAVACSFYADEIKALERIGQGQQVKVKGNCTGILTDVILNKCSIVP